MTQIATLKKEAVKKATGSYEQAGRDRSFEVDEQNKAPGQKVKDGREYLPVSDDMERYERTDKEKRGRHYIVADFDLLDEDTKPEIFEQFTVEVRPRSLECFGVWLQPGYQARYH